MADKRISELNSITGANTASGDLFVIVDVDASETKKITRDELTNALELTDFDNIDINGGTIDGTTIGGSTPAAGTFTGLTVGDGHTIGDDSFDNLKILGSDGEIVVLESTNRRVDIRDSDVLLATFEAGGDISFYEDTGTTPKFFWDASAERLGIGTTSPSHKLVVSNGGAEGLEFNWASGQSTNFLQSYNRSTSSYLPMTYYASEQRFTSGASATEAMRIDSSGNVHITDNTNGPDDALHIEKTTPRIRLQLNGNSGYNTIESGGTNELIFGRTGSEQMRIDDSGNLDLTNGGGNIIMANGAGIDFSATANGSGTTTSELLDDYEVGTWTPVFADAASGGNTAPSYGNREGRYVKVGKTIYVYSYIINVSTTGLTSGNDVHVRGLPFTAESGGTTFPQLNVMLTDVTFSGFVKWQINSNTTTGKFRESASGSGIDFLTVSEFPSGSHEIILTGVYEVD